MSEKPNPSTPSGEVSRLMPLWRKVHDVLDGAECIREKGPAYLPRHAVEDELEYKRRAACAPWQAEFEDILATLAAKPFSKEVSLDNEAADAIKEFAEDVDRRGNNLTTFARQVFTGGLARGWHYVLIDAPKAEGVQNRAQEKAAGLRPYWVSIQAPHVLAYYCDVIGGREVCTHARITANEVIREGFGEVVKERVKVFDPGVWTLYEKTTDAAGQEVWEIIDAGPLLPADRVPLVRFRTFDDGSRPPLAHLVDKQIELYRALARQDEILTKAGYPMLTASGVAPPSNGQKIVVGPGRILFAPPPVGGGSPGSWGYIQPDASIIREVGEQVKHVTDEMRRLGMQPLTQKSGCVTATASAIDGARAHSAAQAWALALKDALEYAFVMTVPRLGLTEADAPEIEVDTDFGVEPFAQAPLDALDKARARKDISRGTYWDGLRRFNVLPADFDHEDEEEALAEEMQGLEADHLIDPVTGDPIEPPEMQAPRQPAGGVEGAGMTGEGGDA